MANPATHTPRALAEAPPAAPTPPYGLLDAATVLNGVEGLTMHGITYPAVCDTTVRAWPLHCASYPRPEGYGEKLLDDTRGWTHADPFGVYAADDCLRGGDEFASVTELRQRFLHGERETVERIIYTGELGNRPALTVDPLVLSATAAATEATPLPLLEAIGALEHWLAHEYGQTGFIHLPRWMGELVASGQVMTESGPRALSRLGSTYVFGTGYDGRPPSFSNGASVGAAEAVWLYASLPVTIRRTDLIEPADWHSGAFDIRSNQPFTLVERLYVADWPCRVAAIPVADLTRHAIDAFDPAAAEGKPQRSKQQPRTTRSTEES